MAHIRFLRPTPPLTAGVHLVVQLPAPRLAAGDHPAEHGINRRKDYLLVLGPLVALVQKAKCAAVLPASSEVLASTEGPAPGVDLLKHGLVPGPPVDLAHRLLLLQQLSHELLAERMPIDLLRPPREQGG